MIKRLKNFFQELGPGLVTGAADDDPSGIATYTQTGAQFGLGQLWTVLFMLPLMIAVQETCARIGVVTGQGITAVAKKNYNKWVLYGVVSLIFIANTVNIGADIGAMAASLQLLVPLSFAFLAVAFTTLILFLEIFTSYKVYSRILKWLAFALFAYLLTLLIIHFSWHDVLLATFVPHIELNTNFLFIITGVLGTTISPYMFFWEASQEVEEEHEKNMYKANGKPKLSKKIIRSMRIDNAAGMLSSQVATWSIIVVAAVVLFNHGITNIQTAADAAKALEPLVQTFPHSGLLAKIIFSIGVIGLGLMAVPVLSSSASYSLAEALNWSEGLNLKIKQGAHFYAVIVIATLIGLLMNFVGIDPIKALIYTAVLNGVTAPPLLFLIIKISNNKKIMGRYRNHFLTNTILWITFLAMSGAVITLFLTLGKS